VCRFFFFSAERMGDITSHRRVAVGNFTNRVRRPDRPRFSDCGAGFAV
jgi:hypothetical protein